MLEYQKNHIMRRVFSLSPNRIIVLGYLIVIVTGSILLNLPMASRDGYRIGYINALFTATSATCVTGLVVADTYTQWTMFGQVVILCLFQIGGLGFMTVATLFSLALRRRISFSERLLMAESLNQYTLEGIVLLTKRILYGTLLFQAAGALIISTRFIGDFGIAGGIFKGIFHAVSAFCNAGFDLMGEVEAFSSFTTYSTDIIVNIVVMALIIIGGLGFAVWNDLYKTSNFKRLGVHTKLVLFITGGLLVFGFCLFLLLEWNNVDTMGALTIGEKVMAAAFQSVTTRTAGFNTLDFAEMTSASKFITMVLMFIGGSPGSTAGGIKTATLGVFIFAVISVIRGIEDVEMFKRRINKTVVMRALAIVMISMLMVMTTTIILSIFEQATFIEVFFESVSAFGTVGLSLGITPTLSDVSKITIIVTMFFGRVGVLTMALAFAVKSYKRDKKFKYPETKIMVG